MSSDYEKRIKELEEQLSASNQEVRNLKLAVRAENLRVKISSEYSNFGLWEYDIADDICYQHKKLNGIYEGHLEPIVHFRDTIISWGSVYVEDIPVFHRFCDAMERGDKEICYDVRVTNDFSDIVWFRYEGKTIFDDSGKPVRVVGRTLDVTEEKGGTGISSDQRRDALTGALQYNVFVEAVDKKLTEKSDKSSAVIIVGLDDYDSIIKTDADVPQILRTLAKVIDTQSAVEQGSAYARIKNGVFALFVRFSDLPYLNTIATRILYRFHDLQLTAGTNGKNITVSAGIAILRNRKTFNADYIRACSALAVAHKKGNRFMQYTSSMPLSGGIFPDKDEDILDRVPERVGVERIYHLLNMALTDTERQHDALVGALRFAGQYTDSAAVYIVWFNDGEEEVHIPWNRNGEPYSEIFPSIKRSAPIDEFCENIKGAGLLKFARREHNYEKYNLEFHNEAQYAVFYPITAQDRCVGYIALASERKLNWDSDFDCIGESIGVTVDAVFQRYYDELEEKSRMSFAYSAISDLSIEGFTVTKDTYTVDYIGENAAQRYDMRSGDICYKKIRGLEAPCPDCPTHQLKAGQVRGSSAIYSNHSRWLDVTASNYENDNGEPCYAITSVDITSCISKIRSNDSLTGVMGFDGFAVEAMRLTAGKPDYGFMVVINIANFRRLNESSGYECGNSVLINVADVLSASLGAGEILCRSEGARFVALYRNTNSNDLYRRLSQLMQSAQGRVHERTGIEIFLIAGAYELTGENKSIMGALDRAILAQKTVKDRAYYVKNMIAFYDSYMKDEMQSRQYVEAHMVEALENGEFKVFYQPKVCTETGRVVGAEALVRWIRPDGEIISPGKFVPVFEQNGFISDMDFAIYRNAIADIKRWLRDGLEVPLISLNVSRHHMRDDSFPDKICALVDNLGVPHHMIELEITESMLTDNMNRLLDIMTRLKESGFKISVDDFGSGYSSLNLITLLPFDTLKIDGGFFLKNELTDKNKAVITSVVELAKNLNLSTVSEGVETDEQVNFLKDLGCDMIQGYYYYKPMPVSGFERIIRANS